MAAKNYAQQKVCKGFFEESVIGHKNYIHFLFSLVQFKSSPEDRTNNDIGNVGLDGFPNSKSSVFPSCQYIRIQFVDLFGLKENRKKLRYVWFLIFCMSGT